MLQCSDGRFSTCASTKITVKVENFNITTFFEIFKEIRGRLGSDAALEFPYNFHMSFGEEYLCDLDSEPLLDFIRKWSSKSFGQFVRFTQINYTIKPIPLMYVDKLQILLDEQCSKRVKYPDPEFKHLISVFKTAYESREIVRAEDQDKKLVGR